MKVVEDILHCMMSANQPRIESHSSMKEMLSSLKTAIQAFSEFLSAEGQKHHGRKLELSDQLPSEVVHLLYRANEAEFHEASSAVSAYTRFCEVVDVLVGRLVKEEQRYQERIHELKVSLCMDYKWK